MLGRYRSASVVIAVSASLAGCAGAGPPIRERAPGTQPAITAADLRSRVHLFADDSMMGREAGTAGNFKATEYLAAQVRSLGLEPAGEDGTFFQTVPMFARSLDPASRLTVNGAPVALGPAEVLPIAASIGLGTTFESEGVPAVYGGRVGETGLDVTPEQVRGKVVVLLPALRADGRPDFKFWAHRGLERFAGAAALAFATLDVSPPEVVSFFGQPQASLSKPPEGSPGAPFGMIVSSAVAEKLLGARPEGVRPGSTGAIVAGRIAFREGPPETPARNVVAVLRGGDAKLRGQYVAIGAHNDHIGIQPFAVDHDSLRAYNTVLRPQGAESQPEAPAAEELARVRAVLDSLRARRAARPDSIANGADDDASGSMTMLEIAEAVASARERPKRSILFVWHTAEEKGLYGSQWFTDHPTVPRDSIVTQLNIDMVGRGGTEDVPGGGPGYLQLIGSRRLSTELGDLVEAVNASGDHGFTFDYQYDANGHPQNYYCRSDHYMYARYGIPIVFFTTGAHRDYHQVTDEPQYVEYEHLSRVTSLIGDIALQVANLDHRPVVDKPKPDPNAPCRQ